MRGEVKRAFNPEFLNRLDDIILFTSLTDDDLIKIMDLLVEGINKNLEPSRSRSACTPDAAKYILEKTCGGSQLRRASTAPGAAEVHRGSAFGSADSGHSAAAFGTGYLSGRHRDLLSGPGWRNNPQKPW